MTQTNTIRVPYHISDLSLTFFAKGRPHDVPADNPNFKEIKTQLTQGVTDLDKLVELADVRVTLRNLVPQLEIVGNEIYFADKPIHGVWVDKIFAFRDEGVPFEPVFNALNSLLKNPTPAAIERLPLFVEKTKLGFLPDGRICGFKFVRQDYLDNHTGTIENAVGSKVSMPREKCDANPDQSCSTGLHVGSLQYLKDWGISHMRVMLVAFWPENAVAVPKDYDGSKLRVCEYDVIDELDKDFLDEFLNNRQNQTVIRGYTQAEIDEVEGEGDKGDVTETVTETAPPVPVEQKKVKDMNRDELRREAKALAIHGRGDMTRIELAKAVEKARKAAKKASA